MPFFRGEPGKPPDQPVALPVSSRAWSDEPEGYLAEPGLVDAVNVALMLGRPLLVTGEPGTGKTQLASSMAYQLGLGVPLRFIAKTTSKASDLFYTYDALGRFQAVQAGQGSTSALDYLTYNALGQAIILANEPEQVAAITRAETRHAGRRRSVTLIDEIDKAPRDFPNDILVELEHLSFRIPELGNVEVRVPAELRPIVVITSNSEKHLPDAFLRRCVYYHIPFPDRHRLKRIIDRRLGDIAHPDDPDVARLLALFGELRHGKAGLRKKPGVAELLDAIAVLRSDGFDRSDLSRGGERLLSALVKTREDTERARQVLGRWVNRDNGGP